MFQASSKSAIAMRPTTFESHRRSVERVILAMREQVDEPFSLQALAEIAILSPYHFDRVFRQMTGIPPCQFLSAVRMETAKRLLLTTKMSVTDICFEVGYSSLGTFIARFTQLVGLSPRRLRRLVGDVIAFYDILFSDHSRPVTQFVAEPALMGEMISPEGFSGSIFVGLFSTPIPQSRPIACAFLSESGTYQIKSVPDGEYYVFATAISKSDDPMSYLLANDNMLVGVCQDAVTIKGGQTSGVDVSLRPLELTDPPLLIALPFLFYEEAYLSGRLRHFPWQGKPFKTNGSCRQLQEG